ncbi:hypothetical protein GIB67_003644, partial [Kingdonia uniflora]
MKRWGVSVTVSLRMPTKYLLRHVPSLTYIITSSKYLFDLEFSIVSLVEMRDRD